MLTRPSRRGGGDDCWRVDAGRLRLGRGQLHLIGLLTRSIRIGVVLCLVGVGMYVVPLATIPVQFTLTGLMELSPWWDLREAVQVAGHTVDPFVELQSSRWLSHRWTTMMRSLSSTRQPADTFEPRTP